jgi:hypothetical protein
MTDPYRTPAEFWGEEKDPFPEEGPELDHELTYHGNDVTVSWHKGANYVRVQVDSTVSRTSKSVATADVKTLIRVLQRALADLEE